MLLLHKHKIINIKLISMTITIAQRLKFFAKCGLWYDDRCSWFENFESAVTFESKSSDSNSNQISNLRRSLINCYNYRLCFSVFLRRYATDKTSTNLMFTSTIVMGVKRLAASVCRTIKPKRLKLNHQTCHKDSPSWVLVHQLIWGQKIIVRVTVNMVSVNYTLYWVSSL